MFIANKPIRTKSEDQLHYSQIIDRIFEILREYQNSIVIGIRGKEGTGRSSFLNLIKARAESDVITVEFDCQFFSESNPIQLTLWEQLAAGLSVHGARETANLITQLVKAVAPISRVIPVAGSAIADIAENAAELGNELWMKDYLPRLREQISAKITDGAQSVFLLVDNLDRLPTSTQGALIQALNEIATLPLVNIVLAYSDTEVPLVTSLIDTEYSLGPITLDEAKKLVQHWIGDELGFSPEGTLYLDALKLLPNLRKIKQWLNQFNLLRHLLKDEVNNLDLLHFTLLQACDTNYAKTLYENRHAFIGSNQRGDRQFFQQHPELLPDDPALIQLVIVLFPRVNSVYNQWRLNSEWDRVYAGERRIAAPEYCDKYFLGRVSATTLPESVVTAALTGNIEATFLQSLQDSGMLNQLLDMPFRRTWEEPLNTNLLNALLDFWPAVEGNWIFGDLKHRALQTALRLVRENDHKLALIVQRLPWYGLGALYMYLKHPIPDLLIPNTQSAMEGLKKRIAENPSQEDLEGIPIGPLLSEWIAARLDHHLKVFPDLILKRDRGLDFLLWSAKSELNDTIDQCLQRLGEESWDEIEKCAKAHDGNSNVLAALGRVRAAQMGVSLSEEKMP